jgi:hypothetical protein
MTTSGWAISPFPEKVVTRPFGTGDIAILFVYDLLSNSVRFACLSRKVKGDFILLGNGRLCGKRCFSEYFVDLNHQFADWITTKK